MNNGFTSSSAAFTSRRETGKDLTTSETTRNSGPVDQVPILLQEKDHQDLQFRLNGACSSYSDRPLPLNDDKLFLNGLQAGLTYMSLMPASEKRSIIHSCPRPSVDPRQILRRASLHLSSVATPTPLEFGSVHDWRFSSFWSIFSLMVEPHNTLVFVFARLSVGQNTLTIIIICTDQKPYCGGEQNVDGSLS